jgi:GT2 family glycosyltransferase
MIGRKGVADLLDWRKISGGLRYMRRRGVSATLRRMFVLLSSYETWIDRYDALDRDDVASIRRHIREMTTRPRISLIMPISGVAPVLLKRAVASVAAQLYPDWELCIGGDAATAAAVAGVLGRRRRDRRVKLITAGPKTGIVAAANAALAASTGEFAALTWPQDELARHALYMVAAELAEHPDAAMIYSDEDDLDARGRRCDPHFKSDWNPDLLLGHDAIGRFAVYHRGLVQRVGGLREGFAGAEEYDLALRTSEVLTPDRIRHIPMLLYHRRKVSEDSAPSEEAACNSRCRAVDEHLGRRGIAAEVVPVPSHYVRVRYCLPEPLPGVSMIVPTRDRADLLRRCLDGLLVETDYGNLEVIIVDNNSEKIESHLYFAELDRDPRVRILRYSGPFNYSAINNFAVAQARHPLIGLINNDVAVIHADWLREMVSHAVRHEIGAVGAKLYYANDTIQHAGTIVGLRGAASHAFWHCSRDEPGYFGRLLLTQDLSAVTAACMLLRKEVYDEVGGFDEVNLAIAYNDVDLCLRIREKGYRILWTPFAELYHLESASRGSDMTPDNAARFQREMAYLSSRWQAVLAHDPYYNPNLTVHTEDFSLASPPRVLPPWRDRPQPIWRSFLMPSG